MDGEDGTGAWGMELPAATMRQERSSGRREPLAIAAILASIAVGIATAIVGSQGGQTVAGLPVFAACVALAFVVQWVAFVPAFRRQTERFFDLTGSLTFVAVAITAVARSPVRDGRSLLLTERTPVLVPRPWRAHARG